jgi:hypothetical protein
MFTTIGRAKSDWGVFGASICVVRRGDEVSVRLAPEFGPGMYQINAGRLFGLLVPASELDFNL